MVSAAGRYSLRRPPKYPFACLRTFFLRWRVLDPPLARGMSLSPYVCADLEIGNQNVEPRLIDLRNHHGLSELALALGGLALELVPLPAAAPLELAGRRPLEPLGRGALRLHLGHSGVLSRFVPGILPGGSSKGKIALVRLGREDHAQHAAFHPRMVLDRGHVGH